MSLDLTIISPVPIKKSGTGIYVRDFGKTRELKTLEEVKSWFPGRDDVQINTYETNELWDGNITHNLCRMASNVILSSGLNLYQLLWRPDEIGFVYATSVYRDLLCEALGILDSSRDTLESYNPSNGWGSYEVLQGFLRDLVKTLVETDLSSGNYKIYVSR